MLLLSSINPQKQRKRSMVHGNGGVNKKQKHKHTHTHICTHMHNTPQYGMNHTREVKKVLYVVCFNVFYTCFLFTKKSSCYFDTHFSHPLFVLAAFAAAIVVCGVFVVVVVVGGLGLGLGGFGGFGAVFFFFPSSPLLWL